MSGDIQRISNALQFIDPSGRETWLRMGMAIKSEREHLAYMSKVSEVLRRARDGY